MKAGKNCKNLISAFLVVSLVAPSILLGLPNKARAQDNNFDPNQTNAFPTDWNETGGGDLGAGSFGNTGTTGDEDSAGGTDGAFGGTPPKSPSGKNFSAFKNAACGKLLGDQLKGLFGNVLKKVKLNFSIKEPSTFEKLISSFIALNLAGPSIALMPARQALAQEEVPELSQDDSGTQNSSGQESGTEDATLEGRTNESTTETESVPTNDKNANSKLDELLGRTKSIETSTDTINKKENCWDSIAKNMMKTLVKKLTLNMANYVNGGRDGEPLWLSDPQSFFNDIKKSEIGTFKQEISDPNNFPYAKDFTMGLVKKFKDEEKKFEKKAKYSLNDVISKKNPGKTGKDFTENFNFGGWDGYLGMTYPQNNPVGFAIVSANELQNRISGPDSRIATIKESLQNGGSFLGDEGCVDPSSSVTHQEDAKARLGDENSRRCNKWAYKTPGKIVESMAANVANLPIKNAEMSEDINSALLALADGALNSFISKIKTNGFKGLTKPSNASNTSSGATASGNGTSWPEFYVTPGSWITNHPDFNLQTDLTQAFIDEQRTHVAKLAAYNTALTDLKQNIYQLDYCIPGPSPDWKDRVEQRLATIEREVPDTVGKPLGTVISIVEGILKLLHSFTIGPILKMNFTVGQIAEGLIQLLGDGTAKEILTRLYYTAILTKITGLRVAPSNQIGSKDQLLGILREITDAYDRAIQKTYNKDKGMPEVTGLSFAEYRKIAGYTHLIENNNKEIAFRSGTITKLQAMKEKIETDQALAESLKDPSSPTISEFARLSPYLVDGNDIASVDDLYKQVLDRKKYIYDDLLVGPTGCENDLDRLAWWQIAYTIRRPYPPSVFTPLPGHNYGGNVGPSFLWYGYFDRKGTSIVSPQYGRADWGTVTVPEMVVKIDREILDLNVDCTAIDKINKVLKPFIGIVGGKLQTLSGYANNNPIFNDGDGNTLDQDNETNNTTDDLDLLSSDCQAITKAGSSVDRVTPFEQNMGIY